VNLVYFDKHVRGQMSHAVLEVGVIELHKP